MTILSHDWFPHELSRCLTIGERSFLYSSFAFAQRRISAGRLPPASCEPRGISIADNVWIGIWVIILAGVTIGAGAVVGAGAVANEDVPPLTVVSGNPVRVVCRLDRLLARGEKTA